MSIMRSIITLILAFQLFTPVSFAQQKVSVHMESKSLQKNKVVRAEADLYFKFPEGNIVMIQTFPEHNIYMSNPLGEARLYNPDKNQLIIKADEMFTSRNQNLYYFLTNETYDLGLEHLGFRVISSEQEDSYFVTNWQAPDHLTAQVNQIKMVHENLQPIFADYLNMKGESVLKVYFSDFREVSGSQIPTRVTEIVFLPEGDSVVKKIEYSDIKWDAQVDQAKFEFTIPENAKVIR